LNVAAKDLSVTRNTANVLARVELYLGRQAVDLSNVTLAAVDSNGRPISAAFLFRFSPEATLLSGNGLRLEGRFVSDGKRFSGDAVCNSQNSTGTCQMPK
jgi:hypothetical protein